MNLTIRNIPEEAIQKLRAISEKERRSLNSQILIALENGIDSTPLVDSPPISKGAQIALWQHLCGSWKDERDARAISDEIVAARSLGRKVEL